MIRALLDTALPSTQSACLLFINSVISPPDEFTYRIHLRNEFIRGETSSIRISYNLGIIIHLSPMQE